MRFDRIFRHRGRQSGFTLVEMVVATILLFVGVVAASLCISASARSTGVAGEYTTAALLAQQKFAEIEAQPDQLTGGDQQGDFGQEHPGYAWRQTAEPTGIQDLYRVTITIDWPGGAQRRSAQFVSYEQTPDQSQTGG